MLAFILRRLLQIVPVLLGISLLAFMLVRLTGDPAVLMLGIDAPQEALLAFRDEYGLNDPLLVQYGHFLTRAIRGDFGVSIRQRAPVTRVVFERMPFTAELTGAVIMFGLVFGLPLGIFSATRSHTIADYLVRAVVFLGQGVPTFYLGIVLILIFAVQVHALPTGGHGTWKHLVLPTVTLGMFTLSAVARFTRASLLEVLSRDFIRTARSKGLAESRVLLHHGLRNALIPLVTVLGLQVGALLGGAVITETVFAWPGIGWLAIQAIFARDFPVVQAVVILTAVIFVLVNLSVDVLYAYLDPRIRYG